MYFCVNNYLSSDKTSKLKSSEHGSKSSPPHSSGASSSGQHGPTKKKKLAEMLVDRVFRKTGSSFKVGISFLCSSYFLECFYFYLTLDYERNE